MCSCDGGYLRKTASTGLHHLVLQALEQTADPQVLLFKPRDILWKLKVLLLRGTDLLDPEHPEVQQEEQGPGGAAGQTGSGLQQCGGNGQEDHAGHQTVGDKTAGPNHLDSSQTG